MEAKIQVLGGKVTNHYTTLVNAMAVHADRPGSRYPCARCRKWKASWRPSCGTTC